VGRLYCGLPDETIRRSMALLFLFPPINGRLPIARWWWINGYTDALALLLIKRAGTITVIAIPARKPPAVGSIAVALSYSCRLRGTAAPADNRRAPLR
jgi:predicted acylesterase/phospholipase RssA